MLAFLLTPTAIDMIILLVAMEAVAMLALRAFGRGPAVLPFAANLLSGAFLLLALRGALGGASAASIGLCLSAALVAHVADLYGRWEKPDRASRMRATLTLRVPKVPLRQRTDKSSKR